MKTDLSKERSLLMKVAKFLLVALPAILTGILVYQNGVDVPFWDQWDGSAPLFEKMAAGTLGVGDFFAQHNEHRIVFPRLLMFGLAQITHWNIRAELFMVWLLGVVCVFNLWRMSRDMSESNRNANFWALVGASALLFTPMQSENWLWGFQIGFLLPMACITGSLWAATAFRVPINFVATMVLSTVSTFSMATGFMGWIVTFPLLLIVDGTVVFRQRLKWWIFWGAAFVVNLLVYFNGYVKPARHPSIWAVFADPISALGYFLAYLGSPFACGTIFSHPMVAILVGAVMMTIFGVVTAYLWRWRRDGALVSDALPWLMLIVTALFNAGSTTIGRLGFGVHQALSSRYIVFSVMLPIGLLFLVPLVLRHMRTRPEMMQKAEWMGQAIGFVVPVLVVLQLMGSVAYLDVFAETRFARLRIKSLIEFINVVDEPEMLAQSVHADVPPLKERANVLNKLGFLRPGLVRSNSIREIGDLTRSGLARYGALQQAGPADENVWGAIGWAVLPEKGRPADAVLLTYDDAQGEPRVFALANVNIARSDIIETTHQAAYLRSGWSKKFKPGRIPAEAHVLRAWAFDAEECKAYQIFGKTAIER